MELLQFALSHWYSLHWLNSVWYIIRLFWVYVLNHIYLLYFALFYKSFFLLHDIRVIGRRPISNLIRTESRFSFMESYGLHYSCTHGWTHWSKGSMVHGPNCHQYAFLKCLKMHDAREIGRPPKLMWSEIWFPRACTMPTTLTDTLVQGLLGKWLLLPPIWNVPKYLSNWQTNWTAVSQ